MAGSISSVGVGSGILTQDVIDQLRENDEAQIITPLDNKIELNKQKDTAFQLLDTLMTTFKSSASTLDDDVLYQSRTTTVNNEAVAVTAAAGSDVQSFTIDNVLLAQEDIQQSATFSARTALVAPTAPSAGVLTLTIDGTDYTVDYDATTTLETLKTSINNAAGSAVTASILQVGEESYSLVLKSDTTGADYAVTLTDSLNDGINDADSLLTSLNMVNVQPARDASFDYNGITISRSGNEISDLINGVTITLKEEGETSNVSIVQDTEAISSGLSSLVESYNNLMTNIKDMTTSDIETGTVGIFNGDNFINSISREINAIITSTDSSSNSLVNYGIDIDENGFMTFNSSTFDDRIGEDPDALELLFTGGTIPGTDTVQVGVFSALKEKLDDYVGFNGLMDNYADDIENKMDTLTKERTRSIELLNARYDTMQQQFIAYDAIISKINAQFASLKQIIEAEANAKD